MASRVRITPAAEARRDEHRRGRGCRLSAREAEESLEKLRGRVERLRERARREGLANRPVVDEMLSSLEEDTEVLSTAIEELSCTNQELLAASLETERQSQRYEELFRLAPDAYLVTDAGGVILELNAIAESKL